MKKPVQLEHAWVDPGAEEGGTQLTPPRQGEGILGRAQKIRCEHLEATAKYKRDHGGVIPPPELQLSNRTIKGASRVRFPSEAFRRGYEAIRWDR
jgi:hypothetical protein